MRVSTVGLCALLTLAACSSEETGAPATVPPIAESGTPLAALEPGACLVTLPETGEGAAEVVTCARPHRAEVYAVVELEDGPFPRAAVLDEEAAARCTDAYPGYTGEPVDPTTDRAFAELVPSEAGWAAGDRRVVCLAIAPGGRSGRGSIAEAPGS